MTAKQIDKLLSILDRFATVAERWAEVEYPKRDENAEIEIYTSGHRSEPQSTEEYEQLEVGRFESKWADQLSRPPAGR